MQVQRLLQAQLAMSIREKDGTSVDATGTLTHTLSYQETPRRHQRWHMHPMYTSL